MTSEDRSKYDAAVLATACYIANASDDVRVIEQELDAIPADITEGRRHKFTIRACHFDFPPLLILFGGTCCAPG